MKSMTDITLHNEALTV